MKLGVNSTLDRSLEVLLSFNGEHSSLSVEELAQRLGWPKSTLYRYVRVLEEKGFLVRTRSTGIYTIGAAVLRLAHYARQGNTLLARSIPVMRDLAQAVNETILLAKIEGTSVVCLERVEPRLSGLRISFESGAVLPTNAGATAKVLLAWSDAATVEKVLLQGLQTFTPATITDSQVLLADLARIRRQGYATTQCELDTGVIGLAVPIWGSDVRVEASLSVVAPEARTTLQSVLRWKPLLERAAESIQA